MKVDINSSECTFDDLTDSNCDIVWAHIKLLNKEAVERRQHQ